MYIFVYTCYLNADLEKALQSAQLTLNKKWYFERTELFIVSKLSRRPSELSSANKM